MHDAAAASVENVPKHRSLQRALAAAAHDLGPGSPMPSERALMTHYAVSRATVRKAIDSLVNDGVLERAHGKGTFVARSRVRSTLHLASFSHDMRRRGLEPSSQLLHLSREPTAGPVASFFGGSAGWRLHRLRLADGVPMALELDWLNASVIEDLDAHDMAGSLYTLLAERYASPIDSADQIVWTETADPQQAELLDVAHGEPLMVFERHARSGGTPVQFGTSWYRGDRYALHMSLDEAMTTPAAPDGPR